MKKRRILKSLIMIFATVLSVLSGLIVDSKLTITAHASDGYTLTVKWTEGIEWVATDKDGTDRWTNGSSKTFDINTSAGTYIKLKPGYRLDCLAADAEWSDYTTLSDTLYYDSWHMYEDRTVTIKVISEVFEENGERYTYNGNYHEAGYKLVEVDSWDCTHSIDDDILGYIESDPSDIVERKRLNPTNEKLLASLKTYTSDSRYKIRVGSPYVKYTGEVPDAEGNNKVSQYTLYIDTHNTANNDGRNIEYGADKNNDWLIASNYRCPDKDAGADADDRSSTTGSSDSTSGDDDMTPDDTLSSTADMSGNYLAAAIHPLLLSAFTDGDTSDNTSSGSASGDQASSDNASADNGNADNSFVFPIS